MMSFAGVTRETAVAQMYVDDPATDSRAKIDAPFLRRRDGREARGGAVPRGDVRRVRVRGVPPSNVSRAVYTSIHVYAWVSTRAWRIVARGRGAGGRRGVALRRQERRRRRPPRRGAGRAGSSRRGALGGVDRLGGCRAKCRPGYRLWPRAVGRHPTRGAPRDGARAPRGGGEEVGARRRDGSRRALETRPTAKVLEFVFVVDRRGVPWLVDLDPRPSFPGTGMTGTGMTGTGMPGTGMTGTGRVMCCGASLSNRCARRRRRSSTRRRTRRGPGGDAARARRRHERCGVILIVHRSSLSPSRASFRAAFERSPPIPDERSPPIPTSTGGASRLPSSPLRRTFTASFGRNHLGPAVALGTTTTRTELDRPRPPRDLDPRREEDAPVDPAARPSLRRHRRHRLATDGGGGAGRVWARGV